VRTYLPKVEVVTEIAATAVLGCRGTTTTAILAGEHARASATSLTNGHPGAPVDDVTINSLRIG
jgi:hypothetical protein